MPPHPVEVANAVERFEPERDCVLAVWLGQAGFLLKTSGGRLVVIDPYLSNDAEATHGLRRVIDPPLLAETLAPDLLFVTHEHVDHLDPSTVRAYGSNGVTTLLAPPVVCRIAQRELGWANECVPLEAGASTSMFGVCVEATWTRHGDLDETASVGFRLEIDNLRLWHAGDTEYDARLHRAYTIGVDVAFIPINGSGGNMNAFEAALLSWQLDTGLAVPMHFGMWSISDYSYRGTEPWATPDPTLFATTLNQLSPNSAYHVPTVGEALTLSLDTTSGRRAVIVGRIGAHG